MNARGFTLLELLISVSILCLLMFIGMPTLSAQIKSSQLSNASQSLFDAMVFARSQAVFSNERVTIKNADDWLNGWEIFRDPNDNGVRDPNEQLLATQKAFNHVRFLPNTPVHSYISFIGSGESRLTMNDHNAAFQAGTINICPEKTGGGTALILSPSGRVRTTQITHAICK